MNKTTILLVALLCSLHCATHAQRIKGSDTVLPLTQTLSEIYMDKHPEATITVTGGGSGVGISALLDEPPTLPWLRAELSSVKNETQAIET